MLERAFRLGECAHYETATIAHNLRERADAHVQRDTVLSVVGNDLPNVAAEDYPWCTQYLPEWLHRGARLRYYALNPSGKALAGLRRLHADFPEQVEVRVPTAEAAADDQAAQFLRLWQTYHFAVFENVPQLWVETHHPVGEREAKDCYYFPPAHAMEQPLYDLCKLQFNGMFEKFGQDAL